MAKQRIIAITGASGGLAQEIVKQLSPSDGIILLGRDKDKLEKCYRHVENKTCLAIDLRDDNAIKEMVDYLYQRFGRIDVFINNAGFGEFKSYDCYTSQEVRDMFDINTFATMTFSRLMAEKMVEQGHGHIINIASMAGKIATANSSVYAATKFAVIGFSDALRLELADKGVYVTTSIQVQLRQASLIKLTPLELILRVLKSLSSVLSTLLKRLSVFWAKTNEKSICHDS